MEPETSNAITPDNSRCGNAVFDAFMRRLNERFLSNVKNGDEPLFTTDAREPFTVFLNSIPAEYRQYHTCSCCRQFMTRFGGLATIDAKGHVESALWNVEDAPEFYKPAIAELNKLVDAASVTGVFLSSAAEWGSAQTGRWTHFAVTPPKSMLFHRATQTDGQARAEKREDYKTILTALEAFDQTTIDKALSVLRSESLQRGEAVLGQAEWLLALHQARARARGTGKTNVVWRAVATAPAGFCHPRSSMIGTLLEDIAAGMPFDQYSRRFIEKMHPLRYQRPQAAPSAGTIAAAEKIVEKLGAAGSLARRLARVDELTALWTWEKSRKATTGETVSPGAAKATSAPAGFFASLSPKSKKAAADPSLPRITMTLEKFRRTVLPTATKLEYLTRSVREGFASFVTAVNPDAPPILQWDREDARNPVSLY